MLASSDQRFENRDRKEENKGPIDQLILFPDLASVSVVFDNVVFCASALGR